MADYDRLKKQIEGDILKSSFDRGRYATDSSIYQIMPQAVMVPKTWQDVEAALDFATAVGPYDCPVEAVPEYEYINSIPTGEVTTVGDRASPL